MKQKISLIKFISVGHGMHIGQMYRDSGVSNGTWFTVANFDSEQ